MAYDDIIKKASNTYGVDEKLIKAVIKQESNYNTNATSSAGAQGLMQLMPETAQDLGVKNPYDPEQNIMGGTKYLRQLLDRYSNKGLTAKEQTEYALAAYNWGMGNVENKGLSNAPTETKNYVSKDLSNYKEQGGSVSSTVIKDVLTEYTEDSTLKWWGNLLVVLLVIVLGVFTVLFTMGALNDTGVTTKIGKAKTAIKAVKK